MALKRVAIPSPNYSSRGGTPVRLVVLHTAEGATTYQSLGAYFASPSSGVSSHVGIDDTPNTVGEYVKPDQKAWTQANANPYSVAAEMCAFAAWTADEWNAHPTMLSNTAAWVAEECARFSIPLRALSAAQAQGGQAGVCDHAALGADGGGHWDIGSGLSVQTIVNMAATGGVAPTPSESEGTMISTTPGGTGYFSCTYDGAVYAFGDAVYKGAPNVKPDLPKGRKIVGITCSAKDGYRLLSDGGDVYCYGTANFYGKPDRV
jgi:hypothetical protein